MTMTYAVNILPMEEDRRCAAGITEEVMLVSHGSLSTGSLYRPLHEYLPTFQGRVELAVQDKTAVTRTVLRSRVFWPTLTPTIDGVYSCRETAVPRRTP